MKRKEFAEGVFILNDKNGKPCCVGDKVKVKVGKGRTDIFLNDESYFSNLPEKTYIGTLVLLKSKGVAVRLDNGNYIFPRLTNNSIRKWEWELIKAKKDE